MLLCTFKYDYFFLYFFFFSFDNQKYTYLFAFSFYIFHHTHNVKRRSSLCQSLFWGYNSQHGLQDSYNFNIAIRSFIQILKDEMLHWFTLNQRYFAIASYTGIYVPKSKYHFKQTTEKNTWSLICEE